MAGGSTCRMDTLATIALETAQDAVPEDGIENLIDEFGATRRFVPVLNHYLLYVVGRHLKQSFLE